MPNLIKMRIHARDSLNDVVYEVNDVNSLPISDTVKRFLNSEAFLGSLDPYICIGDEDAIIELTLTEK